MNKLEQAARQALEALEICNANVYVKGSEAISALREALAEPKDSWPESDEHKRQLVEGQRKWLAEQAEQEPFVEHAQYDQHGICRMQKFSNGVTEFYGQDGSVIMRLDSSSPVVMDYAAHVRTKYLTDYEIDQVRDKTWCFSNSLREFARAVIAADREKNRGY